MNTGYTKDLSDEQKRENEISAITGILRDYPDNKYWQFRLESLLDEKFADIEKARESIKEADEIADNTIEQAREVLARMQDNPDHQRSMDEIKSEYYEDYGAGYKERNDLYHTAIGC